MVAVLADKISRVDLAIHSGYDPALPLGAVIERYVQTWIAAYSGYSKAQTAFELHLLLSALENEELRRRLAETLDAEIGQLARLLENRVIDPARPSDRTTPQQGMAIATAMKAILTGFGLREPFMADPSDLARQSCLALTALVRTATSRARRALRPCKDSSEGRSPWSRCQASTGEPLKLKVFGQTRRRRRGRNEFFSSISLNKLDAIHIVSYTITQIGNMPRC